MSVASLRDSTLPPCLEQLSRFGKQVARPAVNILILDVPPHFFHAAILFFHGHRQCLQQFVRKANHIIRIDQEGVGEFSRRTGEVGQHQRSTQAVAIRYSA
jgi:hypothetical protein